MNIKKIKYELQNILSGTNGNSYDALIQTITCNLTNGSKTSPMAETKHQNKEKETRKLIDFAKQYNLIINDINEDNFISSGAEQKVYIKNEEDVIKLNDSIYYASWGDYFNNLLLHNFFFADTAYRLLGFHLEQNELYAVVQQPFVQSNELTNLNSVKSFLKANGFINQKNHDYYTQN